MSIFTEAWLPMLQQQQFPPANGHEGAGHGGSGDYGGGDKGDGSEAEPDRQDRAREARSREAVAAAESGFESDLAPVAERDLTDLAPAKPADTIPGPVADVRGYVARDLDVDPTDLSQDEQGRVIAKGQSLAELEARMVEKMDPFAQAVYGLMTAIQPGFAKVAKSVFGQEIDPKTGSLVADFSHTEDPDARMGGGPEESGAPPDEEIPDPEKKKKTGPFGTDVPAYMSPVDRGTTGEQAVSQFLATMRQNVTRASARLARI